MRIIRVNASQPCPGCKNKKVAVTTASVLFWLVFRRTTFVIQSASPIAGVYTPQDSEVTYGCLYSENIC